MTNRLVAGASHILGALPFAQVLTHTTPSVSLTAATALLRNPAVRRFAPGLTAVATVGLAAIAVASFVKGFKARRAPTVSDDLERSTGT